MNDRIGQQFGRYRLTKLLDRGGFAEVYLGQHLQLSSQQAAIKILSATHLDKAEDMQAFEREAETISSLVHPHIVRLLDFNITEDEKIPFLVMDYAPNGSLRHQHPLGTRVPLSTVVSYVQQVVEGVQYAHDQKHIHRDIKSDNMLIGRRGEILLSDFGIAVMAHRPISMKRQNVIGTPLYMAPEQFRGYPTSASDQYSLGIVVYEWLCGECPFRGTDFYSIGMKHINDPVPSLRQMVPTLSQEVEQVVLKALAKKPEQRFQDVQKFAIALERASSLDPLAPLLPKQTLPPSNTPTIPASQPLSVMFPAQVVVSIPSPVNTIPGMPPAVPMRPAVLSTPRTKWEPKNPYLIAAYSISWIIFGIIILIVAINIYNPSTSYIIFGVLLPPSIVLFFSWGWILAQKTGEADAGSLSRSIGIATITIVGGPIYWGMALYRGSDPNGYEIFAIGNAIEGVIVGILLAIPVLLFAILIGFGATFLGGLIGKRLSQN